MCPENVVQHPSRQGSTLITWLLCLENLSSQLLGNRDSFCRLESIISVRKSIKFLVFYSYRASFTCLVCSHAQLASDACLYNYSLSLSLSLSLSQLIIHPTTSSLNKQYHHIHDSKPIELLAWWKNKNEEGLSMSMQKLFLIGAIQIQFNMFHRNPQQLNQKTMFFCKVVVLMATTKLFHSLTFEGLE